MKLSASLLVFVITVSTVCQAGNLLADEPANTTVSAGKLTWNRNLYAGYIKAMAEKKPLVVLFTLPDEQECEWCIKLDSEVLNTKEFQTLAGHAIYVRAVSTDEDDKGNYAQLKADLKIERYPVTVVLDVNSEGISESGKIIGFFKRDEYVGHMTTFLKAWQDAQKVVSPE